MGQTNVVYIGSKKIQSFLFRSILSICCLLIADGVGLLELNPKSFFLIHLVLLAVAWQVVWSWFASMATKNMWLIDAHSAHSFLLAALVLAILTLLLPSVNLVDQSWTGVMKFTISAALITPTHGEWYS